MAVTTRPPLRRPRLVVLRALGLGDLLTAVPALRALRRGCRDHELVLLAPRRFAGLVQAAGVADRIVDTAGLDGALSPGVSRAELAVNLHGHGPQSHRRLRATQPHRLIAFASDEAPEGGYPLWRGDEHEVDRWCRLVSEFGFTADRDDLRVVARARPMATALAGATVIHPGAASAARRWPARRWAEVARAETRAGRRVVLTGGPDERILAHAVAWHAGLSAGSVLAGRTDVLDLLAVVSVAARVVCGDTGVAHVATAVGTPSVVLFGPTSPEHWGPPARPWHRALWMGGRGDPHGDEPHLGLLAISVADVIWALETLPERPRGERMVRRRLAGNARTNTRIEGHRTCDDNRSADRDEFRS